MIRVSMQNHLIFSNKSSAPILKVWKIKRNDFVPDAIKKDIALVSKTQKQKEIEITSGTKTYSFVLVAVPERGYVNMYGRDITERVRAEKALHESENQLSRIYNNVSDVLFVLALEPKEIFRFVSINKRFLEVTGLPKEQVLGKNYREVISKQAHTLALQNYKKAILTRRTISWEGISVYPTGVQIGEISITPVFDENDVCSQLIGRVHDLTEHRHAEEALRKSEESFRNLFENSTVGLYRTAPNGEILLANPTLVSMLGYESFKDLAKRNLERGGFEPGYKREEFKKLVENGTFVQGMEIAWRKKDGATIYVRESAKVIHDANGKVQYYEGTVEDVTERRMAEKKLERSTQELKVLNEELERFNKAAVGRELRMIELKKQINELNKKIGQKPSYPLATEDGSTLHRRKKKDL
jgi:PAS domain S-box-containing protein